MNKITNIIGWIPLIITIIILSIILLPHLYIYNKIYYIINKNKTTGAILGWNVRNVKQKW